jgi:hypothetical protein
MTVPETSAATRQRWDDLVEELAAKGVTDMKMFGVPALRARGKAIACLWGDAIVFKLPEAGVQEALALEGSAPFDPIGGRPMKEWIVVPSAHASAWRGLADQAFDFLTSMG